jgi:hypothetical protein
MDLVAACQEVIDRLTPDDEIRAPHTRAVETAKIAVCCRLEILGCCRVGAQKDKTLARREWRTLGRCRLAPGHVKHFKSGSTSLSAPSVLDVG